MYLSSSYNQFLVLFFSLKFPPNLFFTHFLTFVCECILHIYHHGPLPSEQHVGAAVPKRIPLHLTGVTEVIPFPWIRALSGHVAQHRG